MSQWGAADAPFDVDSFDLDAGSFLASWACQICTFRHEGPRATFLRCEMCSATRCNNAREATSEPRVDTAMGSAPTVKSEPDVYEPCYDCAVCWESCRSNLKANKRLMTCVRCPAVRMVHGACYDKMARKSCTQCNGPMSEYQHPSKPSGGLIDVDATSAPRDVFDVGGLELPLRTADLELPLGTVDSARQSMGACHGRANCAQRPERSCSSVHDGDMDANTCDATAATSEHAKSGTESLVRPTKATNRASEGEASRSSEPSADRSFASVNKCAAESDLDGKILIGLPYRQSAR